MNRVEDRSVFDRIGSLGSELAGGAKKIAVYTGRLASDSTFVIRICQLIGNSFALSQMLNGASLAFNAVTLKLSNTVLIGETFGGLDPFSYFLGGKHTEEEATTPENLKQASFLVSGVCGLAVLVSEIALASLSKTSLALNTIISVGAKGAVGFAGLGFVFFVCNDIKKLKHPIDDNEKKKTLLDLVSHVAGVALCVIGLMGSATVAPLVILGTVSAGFGVLSQIYGEHLKELEVQNTK